MARSVIGTEVQPPEWLDRVRPGMTRTNRAEMNGVTEGVRALVDEALITLSEAVPHDCNCLVSGTGGHFGAAVILNPSQEDVGESRIALLYENMMYVGADPRFVNENDLPYAQVGRARSMWWVKTNLQPGWYNNAGTLVDVTINPQYLDEGTEIMPINVANGTRLLGQLMRVDRLPYAQVTDPVQSDRGGPLTRWVVESYIVPRPEHRPATPEAVPMEYVDPTVDMTHEQKVTRLQERFAALTRATAEKAVDEDWCSNYEDACEAMGLAESDYTKEQQEEDVTYSVRVRLSYNISATAWDEILNSRFGGSHDIQDDSYIDSTVSVTVTQAGDFDRDNHDWDEILDSAGYNDYDEIEIENWTVA